jgi:glycerol 3-phosphatase-2
VGDRLDTDILGARRVGYDSLLVTTGVTGLPELVAAREELRPSYVGSDLGALNRRHPAPVEDAAGFRSGCWRAEVRDDTLTVSRVDDGEGSPDAEHPQDAWWRVVAAAAWTYQDTAGRAPDLGELRPPGSVGA